MEHLDHLDRTPGALPIVYIDRPRCPHCESLAIVRTRSTPQGDGSQHRYMRCRACQRSHVQIVESE